MVARVVATAQPTGVFTAMNQPRTQPSLILGLFVTIAAAAVSLGCPGDPVPVDVSVDVLDLLTSSITVDSTFATDTIVAPSLTATAADGHKIIIDVDWASSNPNVLRLVGTPTSKTGDAVSDKFDGGIFAAVAEGDAVVTGTPKANIKTVNGKSVVYRELVSVAGLPASIKIAPASPPVLQVSQDGVTNPGAVFLPQATVRSASGRAIAKGVIVRWTLLDLGPAMFYGFSPAAQTKLLTNDPQLFLPLYAPEIRGIRPGTARLVASLEPRAGHNLPALSDLITVSVGGGQAVVSGVTDPMEVGDTRVFTVQVRDRGNNVVSNPGVQWSTSRAATASVDQAGRVTAISSAADGDTVSVLAFIPSLGITGQQLFTVYRKVASMTLDPSPINIQIGGAVRAYLHLADAAGRPITKFVGGDPAWAMVGDGSNYAALSSAIFFAPDTTRLLTSVALGDAVVKVTFKAISVSTPIHVIPKPVAQIVLAVPTGNGFRPPLSGGEPLTVGVSFLLTATAKNEDGVILVEPLQFSTTQTSVIRLTGGSANTATITALAPGSATITVTSSSKPSVTATMLVIVTAAVSPPQIVFTPTAITATIAGSDQVNVSVTNPIPGGTLVLAVRDPGVAAFSQSSNTGSTARGSITGLRSGSTFMDATYTAGSVVVRAAAPITVPGGNSRVARIIIEPRDQQVTAPVGFTYRVRFLDAAGNATTPETVAEGGLISFFNNNDAVATITKNTDPTTAQEVSKAAGQTNLTVLYTRNGQNVAVDNTDLTVNAAGSAGNYGSLTISTNGNVRQLRVGETVLFQVVVRDVNNVILTTGVTVSTDPAADGTILRVVRTSDTSGYFYNMTGVTAGSVTLKASVTGAATSIPIVVTP